MAEKNKGGRPPALIPDEATLKIVKGLGQIQATTKECAAVLGVTEMTYIAFKKRHAPLIEETYAIGAGEGLASLRRRQFQMSEKSATMAIWLGKQYLGQSDKQEIAGKDGGPIQTIDLSKATNEQLAALETLFGPLAESGDDDEGDQGGASKTHH